MNTRAEIEFQVDHGQRRVNTIWRGLVDVEAVARSCRQRTEIGAHQFAQFIDATAAEVARSTKDSEVIGNIMMRQAERSQKSGFAGPTAVLVHSEIDYGMCRVIAAYFEPAGIIQVFYDRDEALQWLDSVQTSEKIMAAMPV